MKLNFAAFVCGKKSRGFETKLLLLVTNCFWIHLFLIIWKEIYSEARMALQFTFVSKPHNYLASLTTEVSTLMIQPQNAKLSSV